MFTPKKSKTQKGVRYDSKHIPLRTGEAERKNGGYVYRWTEKFGKRHAVYAATLEYLREEEEQILVDQHDGIKSNVKNLTVNDVIELWSQLKRRRKGSAR